MTVTRQSDRGRPRKSQRPRVSRHAGCMCIATSCKRKPFRAVISFRSHDYHGNARTCHRRRRSRRKPAAARGTCAARMHVIRNMPLAGSPAVASRPAEAARCFEVMCEHPYTPVTIRIWRERSAHMAGPYRYATSTSLRLDGRDLLAPSRLAPTISLDFSRSNARGRSDLHSPNDAWMSQTHACPGILQDRRGMNAASSPFRQNGDSRLAATGRSGFREQIDGIGWPRANLCIETRDPRDDARVRRAG